jgi:hypothetical protein
MRGFFYFFLFTMSGVTASSTLTVVLTPYTTAEPAASAMANKVQPDKAQAHSTTAIDFKNFMVNTFLFVVRSVQICQEKTPHGGVFCVGGARGIRTLDTV